MWITGFSIVLYNVFQVVHKLRVHYIKWGLWSCNGYPGLLTTRIIIVYVVSTTSYGGCICVFMESLEFNRSSEFIHTDMVSVIGIFSRDRNGTGYQVDWLPGDACKRFPLIFQFQQHQSVYNSINFDMPSSEAIHLLQYAVRCRYNAAKICHDVTHNIAITAVKHKSTHKTWTSRAGYGLSLQ